MSRVYDVDWICEYSICLLSIFFEVQHGLVSLWHPVLWDDLSSGCFLFTSLHCLVESSCSDRGEHWRVCRACGGRARIHRPQGPHPVLHQAHQHDSWSGQGGGGDGGAWQVFHQNKYLSSHLSSSGGCSGLSWPPTYQPAYSSSSASSPISSSPSSL